MLSFWNDTLENIQKDTRNDKFEFIVNNDFKYKVPLSLALGISPLITQNYLKDPSYHELHINISYSNKQEFINFIKGKDISKDLFFELGLLLNNKEILRKWKQSEKITEDNVINNIKAIRKQITLNQFEFMKEEFEFIAEHFELMKKEINQLTEDELIFILTNNKIKIENEDSLWSIVKEILSNDNDNLFNDNINCKNNIQSQNINII